MLFTPKAARTFRISSEEPCCVPTFICALPNRGCPVSFAAGDPAEEKPAAPAAMPAPTERTKCLRSIWVDSLTAANSGFSLFDGFLCYRTGYMYRMESRAIKVICLLLMLACLPAVPGAAQTPAPVRPDAASFLKSVQPLLARHCVACHNAKLKASGLNLDSYGHVGTALEDREVWERVLKKLRAGEMPPEGRTKPAPEETGEVARWIEALLGRHDRTVKPDPGRVTARRLNRVEYNNTIRDLLAIDFRPADDFPADDEGYGFDNIGDVLSLSPVLMEKYLAAAEKIAEKAIVVDRVIRPTVERYKAEQLNQVGFVQARHRFPADAEYDLRAGLGGIRPDGVPPVKAALLLDGLEVKTFEVNPGRDKPRGFEARAPVKEGEHELRVVFLDDTFVSENFPPLDKRDRYLTIDFVEVRGPFNAQPRPLTESHRKVFICGHTNGAHKPECLRKILSDLARRAYRRPVTVRDVDELAQFVELARKEGDSFEQGIRLALQALLVSPHFLFRIERDPNPNDPLAVHTISDHELATRVSYFLWSSMPDEELFRLADEQELRRPGVLEAQVRRMLLDPKSRALTENFAGQWLQLRNLQTIKPDPDRFPAFDEPLRAAMRQETELFFGTIVREDRSILEFIDGKYTFLNERLAQLNADKISKEKRVLDLN